MTSIKVKFRRSTVVDNDGVIYYQIIHNRIVRQITTDYHIKQSEWDEKHSTVVTYDNSRNGLILSVRYLIHRDIERITRIVNKLCTGIMTFTSDDIVNEFRKYANELSFINYMEKIIAHLKLNGQLGTAANYTSALRSFRKFLAYQVSKDSSLPANDIMLDSISSEVMESYEAWQKSIGNIPNTISFYTRIFRAVYRRAIDDDIIEDKRPFRKVYTGVDKTIKRAIPLKILRKIKLLDLSMQPRLDYARDIFFLSLYLRGMSFIDLCFLRKKDLKNGVVTYRRRKTGQMLTIAWTKEMQCILDKYPENKSEYLLPIITKTGLNERCAYKNAGHKINRSLKKIGELINAPDHESWSLYRARHSWASIAKSKGIPINVISEAMGHDNERTTRIYLASLETSIIDKANTLIISMI